MVHLFIANLFVAALPCAEPPPPPSPVQINELERTTVSVPSKLKCNFETVNTKDGQRIRVSVDGFIIEAAQLQIKAPAKAGEPMQITAMENPLLSITSESVRFDKVETTSGPKIRFTFSNNIEIETTRARLETTSVTEEGNQSKRITTVIVNKQGSISVDTRVVP